MRFPLVLASTSVYRRELMDRLGLPFTCVASGVDESRLPEESPLALAKRLALEKAAAVHARHPDAVVIGSDQLVAFEGEVLGKPGTPDRAKEQLRRLAGRSHELITAVTVLAPQSRHDHVDITRLHVTRLTADGIDRYVAHDSPVDCAGSYKIESRGITLFERVESEDATAIQGLPLLALCRILRELGFALP